MTNYELIKSAISAVNKLREILFKLENSLSNRAQEQGLAYSNGMKTILEPYLELGTTQMGIDKGKKKKSRQAKNDPANETALMAIFQKFYVEYPKHVGRGAAIRALRGALKIATADQIIEGAKKYAAWCMENATDFKYIPHPATWLNQQRWLDFPYLVEDGSLIVARVEKLRGALQRARARGDSKVEDAISAALDRDINKINELTQNRCEIATGVVR